MEQVTQEDYDEFYNSLINRMERYSSLHIKSIKSLWPYIKDYYETYGTIKNLLPYETFSFSEAAQRTGINGSVLHAILHDLTVDNLLVFQPNIPGACWTVTEIGYQCFPRIIGKSSI
jgi:hypothetical protein